MEMFFQAIDAIRIGQYQIITRVVKAEEEAGVGFHCITHHEQFALHCPEHMVSAHILHAARLQRIYSFQVPIAGEVAVVVALQFTRGNTQHL